jgi:hypothetical protein
LRYFQVLLFGLDRGVLKIVAMKILEIFIVLGANCKFIDAFYGIYKALEVMT